MSPEQLRGQPLDERSDLFSLGAVLYESIEGRPAFPGETAADRIAAILAADVAPPTASGVPPETRLVLSRAMARDPERRYPSAAAFLTELRALGSGELVAALPDTLAVADFRNLSRDPEDDWIGSGFAESLSADLGRLPGVSLVPREKVRAALAGSDGSGAALGRTLGCRWVLTGAYQRAGRRLRVTSQLSDGMTGETAASEKIDGDLDEMFGMQDRVSAAAAERLRPGGSAPAARVAPRIDVFERHARGRRFFHRLEKGTLDQARTLFEEAVGADPNYAPALAGLAAVHAMRFPFQTDRAELERSESYARRAIAADPDLAEPRVWLGYSLSRLGPRRGGVRAGTAGPWSSTPRASTRRISAASAPRMLRPARGGPAAVSAGRRDRPSPRVSPGWRSAGRTSTSATARKPAGASKKGSRWRARPRSGPTSGVAGYLGECLRRSGELDAARTACLRGLDAVERSDNMYRDTFRGVSLCALGRIALEQGDQEAAHAAFTQAVAHLRGRPRALGGGHLLVQALAGLARLDGEKRFVEALDLFTRREGHDFSFMWACSDDVTLLELSRAAAAVGRPSESAALLEKAVAAGSAEAAAVPAP